MPRKHQSFTYFTTLHSPYPYQQINVRSKPDASITMKHGVIQLPKPVVLPWNQDTLFITGGKNPKLSKPPPFSSLGAVYTVCHSACIFWIYYSMVSHRVQILGWLQHFFSCSCKYRVFHKFCDHFLKLVCSNYPLNRWVWYFHHVPRKACTESLKGWRSMLFVDRWWKYCPAR